jgi:hypothetical protein
VVQTNIWLEEPPPRRLVLGHEITGEVIELGRDVEFIKKGDIVSVPLMLPVAAVKIVKRFDRYLFKCKWRSPEELTDMWIWVVGSEVKQNT